MRALLISALLAFGCGKSSVCELKAHPTGADACAAGVNPDPTKQACSDSMGNPFICRSGLGFCVVCSGASFSDGCTISSASGGGSSEYCVHDCDNC
jgi:hypothetical protein